MHILGNITGGLWLAWLAYWLISARNVKKDIDRRSWNRFVWLRLVLLAITVGVLVGSSVLRGQFSVTIASDTSFRGILGVALIALGLGFAVWARWHLGRDWSSRPTRKEGHELVTSGPYHFVRHPIYSGILLAEVGTALVVGPLWVVPILAFGVVLLFRIPAEERIMLQLFPDRYPAYRVRTKRLIPYVW